MGTVRDDISQMETDLTTAEDLASKVSDQVMKITGDGGSFGVFKADFDTLVQLMNEFNTAFGIPPQSPPSPAPSPPTEGFFEHEESPA